MSMAPPRNRLRSASLLGGTPPPNRSGDGRSPSSIRNLRGKPRDVDENGVEATGPGAGKAMPTKYSVSYGSPMTQLPDRNANLAGSLAEIAPTVLETINTDETAAKERRRARDERRGILREAEAEPEPAFASQQPAEDDEDEPVPDEPSSPGRKRRRTSEGEDAAEAEERAARKAQIQRERALEAERLERERRQREELEQKRLEAARRRREEAERLEAEAEQRREARARRAEEKRLREAAQREDEQRQADERRQAEERRQEEEARRQEEETRLDEEKSRRQEDARRQQQVRRQEELRRQEEERRRQAEQQRLRDEAEAARLAEEQREQERRLALLQTPQQPAAPAPPSIQDSIRSYVEENIVYSNGIIQPSPSSHPIANPAHQPHQPEPIRPVRPNFPDQEPEPTPRVRPPLFVLREDEDEEREARSQNPPRRSAQRPADEALNKRPSTRSRSVLPGFSWRRFFFNLAVGLAIASVLLPVAQYGADTLFGPKSRVRSALGPLGRFIPTWSSQPIHRLSDDQLEELGSYLQGRTASADLVLKRLEQIVPRIVAVQKDPRTGKISVANDFWRALEDRIKKEGSIFILDGKHGLTKQQLNHVLDHLDKVGISASKLARLAEQSTESSASRLWDAWVSKNSDKVNRKAGGALPPDWDRKSGPQIERTLEQLIQKMSSGKGADVLIRREELLRELRDQSRENSDRIKSEMAPFRVLIENLSTQVSQLQSRPVGITKKEVLGLIKEAVSKAQSKKGGSSRQVSNLAMSLEFQVNHFGPGNGANVDTKLTSPTWQPARPWLGSKKHLKHMPQFLPFNFHALTPWSESGQCWCAGISRGSGSTPPSPADVAIKLSNHIIPEIIVLEHISPEATIDPLARPQDVEIWASIDDRERRERARSYSSVHYPTRDTPADKALLDKNFVKIGGFKYKFDPDSDGAHFYRLPSVLGKIGAASDFFVVRAVTNDGAEDHTCFYRIRGYGTVVDVEALKRAEEAKGGR